MNGHTAKGQKAILLKRMTEDKSVNSFYQYAQENSSKSFSLNLNEIPNITPPISQNDYIRNEEPFIEFIDNDESASCSTSLRIYEKNVIPNGNFYMKLKTHTFNFSN